MAKKILMSIFSLFIFISTMVVVTYSSYSGYYHNFIGEMFLINDDFDNAKKFYEKSISDFEVQCPDSPALTDAYDRMESINIMEVMQNKKNYEKDLQLLSPNTKERADSLCTYCHIDMIRGRLDAALEKINEANQYFKDHIDEINDQKAKHLSKINLHLFIRYRLKHQKAIAFDLLENAVIFADKIVKTNELDQKMRLSVLERSEMAELYRHYAIELEDQDKLVQSEMYYRKALSYTSPDNPSYFKLLEDIGINLGEQEKYLEAAEYYTQALEFYKKTNDSASEICIYNIIAYQNFKQGNRKESMEYALKALDGLGFIEGPSMKTAILDTIGCAYQLNEDYGNGEKYMRMTIEEANNDPYFDVKKKAAYYSRLGDLLNAQGNNHEAFIAWDISSRLLDE